MALYLGLDLGTTVLKVTAMNDEGAICASANTELSIASPKPDWAEEDPLLWWDAFRSLIRKVGDRVDLSEVRAVSLSGQMHGLVVYDNSYTPLRPAIIWADKRSTPQVEHLLGKLSSKKLYRITGNPVFTGFLLPSLRWLFENEPERARSIAHVSSPKDYICYRFTGNLRTEPTDALATSAFDYSQNTWSQRLLAEAGTPPELFPDVIQTTSPYGEITEAASKETGLPAGIPVFGASDQGMAAMGAGLVNKGDVMVALSTGGQCLIVADKGHIDPKCRLHTLNHPLDSIGLYMAATLSAGMSLKWYKSNIIHEMDTTYSSFVHGIKDIPLGSDGVFFFPFLSGQRTPYFNPNLRGAFIGLTLSHTRLHLARAIMEGVSYSLRACVDVFREMGLPVRRVILSGGGTKNPTWRQILTDVLQCETTTISVEEHSPFGAALFGKFALEGFSGLPEFYRRTIRETDTIKPLPEQVTAYDTLYREYLQQADYLNAYYQHS